MIRDKKIYPGLFIVFEVIDGTGKTTQIKKLLEYLLEKNFRAVSFYQPTHGAWGKKLRQLFIDGHVIPINDEIQLSINDRRESVENQILPALKEKKIVLLDRYYWSNAAYQGILEKSYEYILEQNKEFPEPDIIVYFDIDVKIAYKRILDERKEIPNQFETEKNLKKSKSIYEAIRANEKFSHPILLIKASESPDDVFNQITRGLMPLVNNWKENH